MSLPIYEDQLWLNLDQESYHLALQQADIHIFQKAVHLLSRKLCGKCRTLFISLLFLFSDEI